jgi:hypothetical protein
MDGVADRCFYYINCPRKACNIAGCTKRLLDFFEHNEKTAF